MSDLDVLYEYENVIPARNVCAFVGLHATLYSATNCLRIKVGMMSYKASRVTGSHRNIAKLGHASARSI